MGGRRGQRNGFLARNRHRAPEKPPIYGPLPPPCPSVGPRFTRAPRLSGPHGLFGQFDAHSPRGARFGRTSLVEPRDECVFHCSEPPKSVVLHSPVLKTAVLETPGFRGVKRLLLRPTPCSPTLHEEGGRPRYCLERHSSPPESRLDVGRAAQGMAQSPRDIGERGYGGAKKPTLRESTCSKVLPVQLRLVARFDQSPNLMSLQVEGKPASTA